MYLNSSLEIYLFSGRDYHEFKLYFCFAKNNAKLFQINNGLRYMCTERHIHNLLNLFEVLFQ